MKYVYSFKVLPNSLKGLFLVFFLIPWFSILAYEPPWILFLHEYFVKGLFSVLLYWLLPLSLCYSILEKHHWFFPIYLVQCLILAIHTLFIPDLQPAEIHCARILLISLMIYVGLLFGNKNFLYPLISKNIRFWRRHTRFQIGRSVIIIDKSGVNQIPALLIDCSQSGARLSVHIDDLTKSLKDTAKGDSLRLMIPTTNHDSHQFIIPMKVAWTSSREKFNVLIGCRALDSKQMKVYLTQEKLALTENIVFPVPRDINLEQEIRETALVLWIICIALSFALPAIGS